MSALLIAAGLTVATVLLVWYSWRSSPYRQLIDRIPGPSALPYIGNGLQLKDGYEGSLQLIEYCKNFGKSGISRIWVGPTPNILLSKASTVERVLSTSRHNNKSYQYEFLLPWLSTGLLISNGDKWKSRRRILTPTFHFKILEDFLQVFNEQSRILVQQLSKQTSHSTGGSETSEDFDIFPYVTLYALDVICESAMGRSIEAQYHKDSDYVNAVHRISVIIQTRLKVPWWRPDAIFLRTKEGKEHQRCLKILHGFTQSVIKERSAELDEQLQNQQGKVTMEDLQTGKPFLIGKQKRLAFLDMLLIMAKGGADLEFADIQEEVDTFMFEGHDTTSAAAVWTIYALGRYPEFQKRVLEEMEQIFGDDDRDVTMEDLSKMKYLECVIKESLRVYPPVPMFGREITDDCEIGGYTVPKGTAAMLIITALHKDPEHFPDPDKFDPDRWLSENSAGRHPYCYVPFSAGSRNCIGQKFAMLNEKVMLSYIVRHFRIHCDLSERDVRPCSELILRPQSGVRVRLTPQKRDGLVHSRRSEHA